MSAARAAAAWLLLAVNLFAFALMGIDKRRAVRRAFRIRERTLLAAAFLGGALGVYAGMLFFRHKTRHGAFAAGVLLMLAGQAAFAAYLLWRLL